MPNPENVIPWKPGQSGNPKGKKKGTLHSRTIIAKWLAVKENIKNPITGKMENMTQYDAIVLAQLAKARNKDTIAFNALLDRSEGKPKQDIELSTPEGGIKVIFQNDPNSKPIGTNPENHIGIPGEQGSL